jgi:glycerol uptake facilitator-like aquaporin
LSIFFGVEMFKLRREPYTQAMFVSFYIMVLILGLGGTTALAVNPARDCGPRLAHALLPIPGKGSSECHYAGAPFFAPFVGTAYEAALYSGIQALYKSGSEEL